VSWRPQLNVICTRCGKGHGLFDTCVTTSSRRQTFKPELSFGKCPDCKRDYGVGGPLTHACAPRSDFRRRKTRFEREQRSKARQKRQADKHDYTLCADNDCPRALCVAYKKGWKSGDEAGFERGWQRGYDIGFYDGIQACPRPHK
jgi:hypothetical protein